MTKLQEIEPGIRVLVDALNETGFLETFSSCEGHFGQEQEADGLNDRTKAEVRAYVAGPGLEKDLEDLILHVLADYMDDSTKWEAWLTIAKEYVADPREDGKLQPLDSFFVFELRPSDRNSSDHEKRRIVDKLIAETAASVRHHTRQRHESS